MIIIFLYVIRENCNNYNIFLGFPGSKITDAQNYKITDAVLSDLKISMLFTNLESHYF